MKLLAIAPVWEDVKESIFIWSAIGILVAIAVLLFVLIKKDKQFLTTREIAVFAFFLALSYTLSAIKIYELPEGGSITLAGTLPLILLAYFFGVRKGLFAGFTYSVLKMTLNPYIIHPIQLLLDYTIAYTAVGVAGLFKSMKKPGLIIGAVSFILLRYICSFLSGIVFFSEYAPTQTALGITIYSLGYNSFVLIDGLIILVALSSLILSPVFPSLARAISVGTQKPETDVLKQSQAQAPKLEYEKPAQAQTQAPNPDSNE